MIVIIRRGEAKEGGGGGGGCAGVAGRGHRTVGVDVGRKRRGKSL